MFVPYSFRNAVVGSNPAARIAGYDEAINAINRKITETETNVTVSVGFTSTSMLARMRVNANAASRPRLAVIMKIKRASDTDADALSYCWEQFDLGPAGPPHTDNGNRPIFRSFAPVPTPARTLPQLSDILAGTTTFGESLPTTNRTLNFRVTARDNHPGGGGVNTGAMKVNVTVRISVLASCSWPRVWN